MHPPAPLDDLPLSKSLQVIQQLDTLCGLKAPQGPQEMGLMVDMVLDNVRHF